MSSNRLLKNPGDVSLSTLFFLCFLTVFLCHARVTISRKPQPETPEEKLQENWIVWNYKKGNVCGLFLKAVIMVSSPIFSLASTLLLLVGVSQKNLYLFLPWLLLTLRGLIGVQAYNLIEVFRSLSEGDFGGSVQDWKSLCLYLIVIIFDAAECFCFQEVLQLFKTVWDMGEPREEISLEEKEPEDKEY